MPKTLRNVYYKYLTFDNLMKAHKKSQNGKTTRKNIVKIRSLSRRGCGYVENPVKNAEILEKSICITL